MTQVVNFKRMEVTGVSKEEAFAQAPFAIMGDATQAYNRWLKENPNASDGNVKQFMIDYLAKKSKNVAGIGYTIVRKSAIADTRERPYKIEDVKNEKGARKYKTIYQIIDKKTGAVLATAEGTKTKAKEVTKKLFTDKGFKGTIVCKYTKQVVDGEPVAFTAKYEPSKNSRPGEYTVFGIEKA